MRNITLLSIQAAILCCVFFLATSHAATDTVNYDTAWTFVYDGGRFTTDLKLSVTDNFYDLKVLSNGNAIFVGQSSVVDSNAGGDRFAVKLDANGKMIWKKLYRSNFYGGMVRSIIIAKNGDYVIGGSKYGSSWIARIDTLGNIKWETWLWDTLNNRQLYLSRGAYVNCLRETSRGTIICAAGDYFTDNNYVFGSTNDNFAAFLELDSLGNVIHWGRWIAFVGYNLGAFEIEETQAGNYLLSGNRTVVELDTSGHIVWNTAYTFSLAGVGSEVNNVTRCKTIRGNIPIVAGQAYEGNCWTKFQHLYYDAWWSPINYVDGGNTTWDTAGYQGGDDMLYDFTQLNNGNLVFVGKRYYTGVGGGMWTFVTDSTGKNLLWEKVTPVPYKSNNGSGAYPMSVCATPDNGFTIAGYLQVQDSLGGYNALAVHFVPKLPGAVVTRQARAPFSPLSARMVGKRLVVTNATPKANATVSLFDVSGKRLAIQTGQKEMSFDISQLPHGMYLVKMRTDTGIQTAKIVVRRHEGNQTLICYGILSSLALV